jgi:hypothetical protein
MEMIGQPRTPAAVRLWLGHRAGLFWRRDTAFAIAEIRTLDCLDQPVHYSDFAILTPYEQYNIKIINK